MTLKSGSLRSGLRNVSTGVVAIPDSDVYLHDDWGDNKLQNRDDSDTTTYNGVEGIYRPEWTIDLDEPSVEGEKLVISGDNDGIYTEINLNLDVKITWEWDVQFDNILSGSGSVVLGLYSETTNRVNNGRILDDGYGVFCRPDDSSALWEVTNGSVTNLIEMDQTGTDPMTITVEREPSGDWEVFFDGVSQGTAPEATHTNPSYISYGVGDGTAAEIDEMKVN